MMEIHMKSIIVAVGIFAALAAPAQAKSLEFRANNTASIEALGNAHGSCKDALKRAEHVGENIDYVGCIEAARKLCERALDSELKNTYAILKGHDATNNEVTYGCFEVR